MTKGKNRLALLLAMAIMIGALAGCGGGQQPASSAPAAGAPDAATPAPAQPESENPPADSEEVTQAVLWSQWSGDSAAKFQAIIDDYNNTQGKTDNLFINIEQVEDENNEMMMKLMAAKLSDTMPDVVHAAQMSFIAMARNGLFATPPADVQSYIKENYYEANAGLAEYNGVHWGYPTEHQVMALYYNKDHFAEAGLPGPPKTWDELRDYAQRLTVRGANGELERAGFLFTFAFSEAMMTQQISMFWGMGEDLFPTETSTTVNSEGGIKLLQLFQDMANDGSTNANWLDWSEAYNNGAGSMLMMDPWSLNFNVRQKGIEDLYEATGIATLPTPDGTPGPTMSRGFEMCVTVGCDNQDKIWEFQRWLHEGPECRMNKFMVEEFEFLPSHKGFDFPATWNDDVKEAYNDIVSRSKPQPDLANYEEVQDVIDNMKDEYIL